MTTLLESYDESYDELYDESWDESDDEAIFRPRKIATARPRPVPQRPTGQTVTQAQLQSAVTKLQGDISRNSAAIQRVNASVNTLGKQQARVRREIGDARRDAAALKDAVTLLPLLGSALGDSPIGALLPMLLLSNVGQPSGTTSGGGGLLGSGDQTTTLITVLALSGQLGRKS